MRYRTSVLDIANENSAFLEYVWSDGRLISLVYGDDSSTNTAKYLFNKFDEPIGMVLTGETGSPETYYYLKNAQGDITHIVDSSGKKKVSFSYDAFGKVTESYYANITTVAGMFEYIKQKVIRIVTPFGYRGYCYDTFTGLYYLQSRYYDPNTGRFINADDTNYLNATGTVLGCNLFAYCENDPVNRVDMTGEFSFKIYAVAAISAALIGAISKVVTNFLNGVRGWKLFRNVVGAAIGNSVNIILLMRFIRKGNVGIVLAAFVAAVVQTVIDFIESVLVDKKYSWKQLTYNLILNFAIIAVGNYIGGKKIFINGYWFQPQKIGSFFTKSYGKKLLAQTGIGSVISIAIDLIKNRLEKRLKR